MPNPTVTIDELRAGGAAGMVDRVLAREPSPAGRETRDAVARHVAGIRTIVDAFIRSDPVDAGEVLASLRSKAGVLRQAAAVVEAIAAVVEANPGEIVDVHGPNGLIRRRTW